MSPPDNIVRRVIQDLEQALHDAECRLVQCEPDSERRAFLEGVLALYTPYAATDLASAFDSLPDQLATCLQRCRSLYPITESSLYACERAAYTQALDTSTIVEIR